MTYARTIPRDLFNEGDLLKCLGRLWIVLEQNPGHRAELSHATGHIFTIVQDPSDGAISCSTVTLTVDGVVTPLFRPLNSRYAWPLWARTGDLLGDFDDIEVFDASGSLSEDMRKLIGLQP